jgi:CxxC motif-containing protein (DUF1111 family)
MVKLAVSLVLGIVVASGFPFVASTQLTASASTSPSFGDPLPGLTADYLADFNDGQEEFEEEETPEDGLGPVFNNTSCAACHSNPAIGGDSNILETRFGYYSSNNEFNAMEDVGGSLLQSQAIHLEGACRLRGETVPRDATTVAKRKTTPLFGLGLVDNVPDYVFMQIADEQQSDPDVAGTPHMVKDVATGKMKVGRFGWKAQIATLRTFAGDAYLNEMGITNPLSPKENAPQGDDSLLETCDKVTDLEDDGAGVDAFTNFMTFLGPPPRGSTQSVQAGDEIFDQIGCAFCHRRALETGPNTIHALDQVTFQPFSDFLLHDMGDLGDGIEQGQAQGSQMRTAPLWGLRVRTRFLHDGRATKLEGAILAHDGQGQSARKLFMQLSPAELQALIAFLKSL